MRMIEQRDYDHLAKKLGYESMAQVRAEREAQERAAAIAKAEAEEKARLEAFEAEEKAKDLEINEALRSGRVLVKIGGQLIQEPQDYHQLVCSLCGKELPQMKDTVILAKRRGTLRGELYMAEWVRYGMQPYAEALPCGAGDGLRMIAQHYLCFGQTTCPHCNGIQDVSIQVAVEHDGKRIPDLLAPSKAKGRR